MARMARDYEKRFPGLQCDMKQGNAIECSVYYNRNGSYITGSLYEDGRINFQRVSVGTLGATHAFLEALTKEGK
jgi:hypothetical protein